MFPLYVHTSKKEAAWVCVAHPGGLFVVPCPRPSQAPGAKKNIGQGPRAGTRESPSRGVVAPCKAGIPASNESKVYHISSRFSSGRPDGAYPSALRPAGGPAAVPPPALKHKSNHFVTLRGEGATAHRAPSWYHNYAFPSSLVEWLVPDFLGPACPPPAASATLKSA